jgi:Uma2 family endonuclease
MGDVMKIAAETIPAEMSVEQFLNWEQEDLHAELVGNQVRLKMPVSKQHQDCNSFLVKIVGLWIERNKPGGVVYHPPFAVRLTLPDGEQEVREPDLLVILPEHLDRLQRTYFDGAPDLIVEIVSRESRSIDRGEKFYAYEAAGVPEYWIIDPERKQAEFAQLSEEGTYQIAFTGSAGVYSSRVLDGFWLRVEWLWSLPAVWDVLKEWGWV